MSKTLQANLKLVCIEPDRYVEFKARCYTGALRRYILWPKRYHSSCVIYHKCCAFFL